MKKLYYEEGPLVMGCGIAGEFRIGEPREIEDELAEILLKKGRLKEFKNPAADKPPRRQSGQAATEKEG